MLQSRERATESPEAARADNALGPGTRVDAAHLVGEALASLNETPLENQLEQFPIDPVQVDQAEALLFDASQAVASQAELEAALLEAQAEQLGQRLRSHQEDLDRREAQFNARYAEFDQEVRTARLWLAEREQALAERGEELAAREQETAQRLEQLATEDDRIRQGESELAAQRERFAAREMALARREEELVAREAELAGREAALTSGDEAHREREELAERERRLVEAETALAAQQAETAAFERELQQRREQLEAQARLDRRRLSEIQRKNEAELARQKLVVERQSEQLDHRRAAVERSRQEVLRLQREALEMRLAAEELRAELEGSLGPAAVERSLSALRQRLGEYYRLEAAAAADERSALESLKAELAVDVETWTGRQQDLRQWATARQAEFDERSARLEAREQELDRLERSHQEQLQAWREERFCQQQEIRRLQTELRQRA